MRDKGETKTLGKRGHPGSKPPCHSLLSALTQGLWKPKKKKARFGTSREGSRTQPL